jgi:hypothetical protein
MTAVFFPMKGCDFILKDKLNNDIHTVEDFIQHINVVLKTDFTGDTMLKDVMRAALESSDTIAYITQNGHSKSLQMKNRSGLKDYVSKSLKIGCDSISLVEGAVDVINDNELNITMDKENEKSAKVERIFKYLKLMRQFKVPSHEDEYIKDKEYREALIMDVEGENYMKRYKDYKDVDDEQIKERIKKQVEMEEEREKKDKVNDNVIADSIIAMSKEVPSVINDNELSIIKKKVKVNKPKKRITRSLMTVDKLLKYIRAMEYYKIYYDEERFIHDKQYREEGMKFVDDNNYLQKYNKEKHRKRGEVTEFRNKDEIQAVLDAKNVEEQEVDVEDDEEQIDDEDDEDPEDEKNFKQILKHLLIIQYYRLPVNQFKFIFNPSYQEEIIKEETLKNV